MHRLFCLITYTLYVPAQRFKTTIWLLSLIVELLRIGISSACKRLRATKHLSLPRSFSRGGQRLWVSHFANLRNELSHCGKGAIFITLSSLILGRNGVKWIKKIADVVDSFFKVYRLNVPSFRPTYVGPLNWQRRGIDTVPGMVLKLSAAWS